MIWRSGWWSHVRYTIHNLSILRMIRRLSRSLLSAATGVSRNQIVLPYKIVFRLFIDEHEVKQLRVRCAGILQNEFCSKSANDVVHF